MKTYVINKPIWDGGIGERAIGIAKFRVPCLVEIDYKNKDGDRIYPDTYIVTASFAEKYPIKKMGKSPPLYVIPISELEEKHETDKQRDIL